MIARWPDWRRRPDPAKRKKPRTILDRIREDGVAAVVRFVKPDHPEPETPTLTAAAIRQRRREKKKRRKRGKPAQRKRERVGVFIGDDDETARDGRSDEKPTAWYNRPQPELSPPAERLGGPATLSDRWWAR